MTCMARVERARDGREANKNNNTSLERWAKEGRAEAAGRLVHLWWVTASLNVIQVMDQIC